MVPILRVRSEFQLNGITCTRDQFPLIPAYAITIHKAQGATLDKAVVKVGEEFSSGLNYVACSRVKTLSSLMIEEGFEMKHVRKDPSESKQFTSLSVPEFANCTSAMKHRLLDRQRRDEQALHEALFRPSWAPARAHARARVDVNSAFTDRAQETDEDIYGM